MSRFYTQLAVAIGLSLLLKVVTFTLTAYLTRLLLPGESGVNAGYMVYVDAVLFVARETTRTAASRHGPRTAPRATTTASSTAAPQHNNRSKDDDDDDDETRRLRRAGASWRRQLHVSAMTAPLALAVMAVLELQGVLGMRLLPSLYRSASAAAAATTSSTSSSLLLLPEMLVWCSVLLCALVEPCVVLLQSLELFRVLVLAECVMTLARLLTTVALLQPTRVRRTADASRSSSLSLSLSSSSHMRLCFALAQLASALTFAGYYALLCNGPRRVTCRLGGDASISAARRAIEASRSSERDNDNSNVTARTSATTTTAAVSRRCSVRRGRRGGVCFPWSVLSLRELCDVWRRRHEEEEQRKGNNNGSNNNSTATRHNDRGNCDEADDVESDVVVLRSSAVDALLRLLLNDGATAALATAGSAAARGYHQTATLLGTLVVRLVFRPCETACVTRWSRHAAREVATATRTMQEQTHSSNDNNNNSNNSNTTRQQEQQQQQLLLRMLRLLFYFGFAFALLGAAASSLVLTTLYSSRWADAQMVRALSLVCHGLPCVAWCGLLEAYVRVVAPDVVRVRLQRYMAAQALLYAVVCLVVVRTLTTTATTRSSRSSDATATYMIAATLVLTLSRCVCALYVLLTSSSVAPLLTWRVLSSVVCARGLVAAHVALLAVAHVLPPRVPSVAALALAYALVVWWYDEDVRACVRFAVAIARRTASRLVGAA